MIRVLHSGDFHLTEGPRFDDTLACLRALVDDGRREGVALWAILGDMTGTTVPHRATILERNTTAALLQDMLAVAPVLLLEGNHEYPDDLEIYGRLAGPHPIVVVTREPRVVDVAGARLFCLPFMHKRSAAADVTLDAQDRAVEDDLHALFASWAPAVTEARAAGMPTLFLGHGMVRGCAVAGGEVLPVGRDIEIAVEDLEALGCDYSGLSHVHLRQQMAPSVWYAGSPSRSTFDETDTKGHLIVDVDPGRPPVVHSRFTPARRFTTLDVAWDVAGQQFVTAAGPLAVDALEVDGAEVRVRVTIPQEAATTCPVAELTAAIAARGAVDIKPVPRIVPKVRVRNEEIAFARSTTEKLVAFWKTLEPPIAAEQARRCLDKLPVLERAAA